MASSNVSAVTNLLATVNEGFITALNGPISSGATTVPLTSVTGLTNGTVFVGIIEPGQDKQQVFTGTVDTGGGQITGVKWTRGTNVPHTSGVAIVDYVTGTAFNMLSRAISVEHNQTGTHNAAAAVSIASAFVTGGVPTAKLADDAGITAAKLGAGSVTFPKLAAGSTRLGLSRNAGATLNTTTWQDFASVTATSTGGVVECEIAVSAYNGDSGANRTVDIRVLCDGSAITPASITGLWIMYVASNSPKTILPFNFSSTPAAGSHTWKIQVECSTANAVVVADNYIKVAEVA